MAFVLGEVAAYQMGKTVWFIVSAVLLALAVIKTAEGRVESDFQIDAERVRNWKEPMMCRVLLLFFCFLMGWGRMTAEMRPDALERMVTQKGGSAEVAVSGTLDSISEKNGWCTMVLTGARIEERKFQERKTEREGRDNGAGRDQGEKRKEEKREEKGRKAESIRKVLVSFKSDLLDNSWLSEDNCLSEATTQVNDARSSGRTDFSGAESAALSVERKTLPSCGSQIYLTGAAEFLEDARNPGQFSYRMYYRGLGIRNRVTADQIFVSEGTYSLLRRQAECFRAYAKAVFQEICAPEDAGIFQAILLGDKSGLSEELRERFQDNGIAHILAVSGLHVSLIGMSVYSALRFLGVSYGWSGLGATALLTFYGVVTGFGASVFRAVFMVEVSCLAAYMGRSYDLLSALSLSLILQVWQSPYLLFSPGLQLSYGAVAAIGVETGRLQEVRKRRKERKEAEKEEKQKRERWKTAYEAFTLSTAIQLYTMPIQLYHYFTFPLLGIFLNLIVIPLLTYAAGSGLLALGIYSIVGMLPAFWSKVSAISEIFRMTASACTGPGHYIFQLYEWLCIQVERLPLHSIVAGRPEMWKIGVFYAALGIWYVWSVRKTGEVRDDLARKGVLLFQKDGNAQGKETKEEIVQGKNGLKRYVIDIVFIALAVLFLVFQPVHGFQIWFLDVGQGDGVFLRTRDMTVLSDCGSSQDKKIGENMLEPFLKSQGVHTLDWILVSHADADHTNGIEWLLKEKIDIRVRHLALPAAGKGQEAYEQLEELARERGAEVYYLHRGETVWAKSLSLRCMYPEAGEKSAEERNSHSLVFDVTYGNFSMLLTGDIGVEDEREILLMEEDGKGEREIDNEKRQAVVGENEVHTQKVTLLKAAHHGSNGSSSEEFLDYFSPSFTVLSYGEGNSYGHPAPEAVERLERVGTEIWRTADSGAVNVWTDGKRMRINGYKQQN